MRRLGEPRKVRKCYNGPIAKPAIATIVFDSPGSYRVSSAASPGKVIKSGLEAIMEEIETKVIEIVSEQMGVDKSEITRETHFINDLNADSLDTVELVMEFEDEFELSIPDEEAEKIQTVGQAIDYIREHSSK
jgi:acyl carrier protein